MMMKTDYASLKPDYDKAFAEMKLVRETELTRQARHILNIIYGDGRYNAVAQRLGIPAPWIAAIDYRESDNDPHTYLGNGQSLYKITTEVPVGRGPFVTWGDGAADALRSVRWDQTQGSWSYIAWQTERWNGFGYRRRGVTNPYVWAGSTIYTGGMFVSDHVYDYDAVDKRLGVIPLMIVIAELAPEFTVPEDVVTS
jgi:lysozyme family protein